METIARHKRTCHDGPVRVLYLTSSLASGGAERLLVDLFAHRAGLPPRQDIELYYVVMNKLYDPSLRTELEQSGAEGWFLERREGDKSLRYLRMLSKIVQAYRIDVIHTHTTGSKHWGALLKLLHPRIKLLYTSHSTVDVIRYGRAKLFLHRTLVDQTIAISKTVEAHCRTRGLHKTTLIYNGINLSRFGACPPRDIPARHEPRLLHVGRLVPDLKGQDLLIEAVARCRRAGFFVGADFLGEVNGVYAQAHRQLLAQAAELGLDRDAVRFCGYEPDIPGALNRYDCFVCSSREEGLGLAILEAMAAGLPVIACDIAGPAELVEEGVTGYLFRSGDAASLSDTIRRAFADPQALAETARRGRDYAQRFGIDTMYVQYARLYRHMAGRNCASN